MVSKQLFGIKSAQLSLLSQGIVCLAPQLCGHIYNILPLNQGFCYFITLNQDTKLSTEKKNIDHVTVQLPSKRLACLALTSKILVSI